MSTGAVEECLYDLRQTTSVMVCETCAQRIWWCGALAKHRALRAAHFNKRASRSHPVLEWVVVRLGYEDMNSAFDFNSALAFFGLLRQAPKTTRTSAFVISYAFRGEETFGSYHGSFTTHFVVTQRSVQIGLRS